MRLATGANDEVGFDVGLRGFESGREAQKKSPEGHFGRGAVDPENLGVGPGVQPVTEPLELDLVTASVIME
ncbi:hypothetical protein RE428_09350 [Marinobacter nanhaiticus D15-8W]|nr:hypothetical protein RE428_09350 [Marinobacter nanhaiticus D15-8W]